MMASFRQLGTPGRFMSNMLDFSRLPNPQSMPSVRRCGSSPLNVSLYSSCTLACYLIRRRYKSSLARTATRDAPFTVSDIGRDGTVQAIWARVPLGEVLDAFSADGEFEKTYAKAFVVFTYQLWEEFARPKIADALGVKHDDVASDLMGEWRHLRNLLVHPSKENEQTYFKNAKLLAKIPGGLRPGNPEVKADLVFPMMGYLNSLHVIVNPNCLSPAIEIGELHPKIGEQISIDASGSGMSVLPVWRGFRPPVQS